MAKSNEPEGIDPTTGQTKSAAEKFRKDKEKSDEEARKHAEEVNSPEYAEEQRQAGREFSGVGEDETASSSKSSSSKSESKSQSQGKPSE